jgi:hypothetical protein
MTYFNNICRIVLIGLLATWLTACGGGGGEAPVVAAAPRLPSANNVLSVSVNSGLMGNSVNLMYASVTICLPGSTTQCQTVDNIMVDTGSTGLRLLSSALSPSIK